MDLTVNIRALRPEDEPFLWEMLYQAIYIPAGQAALPRSVVHQLELACYVQGWGCSGDCGFLASDSATGQPVGAVWLRLLQNDTKGYGYVDDDTPELSVAVLPSYRGRGIGTRLLARLFESDCTRGPISLSVSADNPAVRLYERFGFKMINASAGTLIMRRP